MLTIVSIGAGGAVGAILRYFISKLNISSSLPIGTLLANIIGSFLLGYLYFYFNGADFSPEFKLAITQGFLGALTTYSTIQLQLFQFIHNEEYSLFTLYFFLNIFVGLICIFIAKWVYNLTL